MTETVERMAGAPKPVTLDGQRYRLHTLLPDDVTARYVSWLRDPEVTRFLEVRLNAPTLEGVREWVAGFDHARRYLFGIYARDSGQHLGTVTLYDWHPYHGTAYYGYMLGEREYWGRGVMTEVLTLLFDFAFDTLGVRKLNAGAYVENIASIVNFQKMGLHPEGVLRQQLRLDDRYVDEVLYGIDREQWAAHKATLAELQARVQDTGSA